MRAPLEATETLMPDQMDMDRIRCLFETCMEVKGNLLRQVDLWLSTDPNTNWKNEMQDDAGIGLVVHAFFDRISDKVRCNRHFFLFFILFVLQGCSRFKMPTVPN